MKYKEFLFIGAEPHIKCNFQLVYGFGCYEYGIENTVKHHFKDEKNIWYNLANVFVEDCTEIDNVTNFLKKCYITDLCHIVPQDCGQVKDICKKLSIKNSDWGNFRKQVAIEFLFKEIAVVKPKFIILHGDPSRKFFKQYLNERIHPIECSNLKILEGKIEIEGNEYKIISIPHLAGQMKNELWRSHKYPKRPKSAKEIIRKLVYDKC